MAKKELLKTYPLHYQDNYSNLWYFESPVFELNGFRYTIVSTDGTLKNDAKHTIRTPDNRVVVMKTSEIVQKFKELKHEKFI